MAALISVRKCRVQDRRRTYIPQVSWQMNAGEAWLMTGANGSGKDMFLRALAGEKDFVPNWTAEQDAAFSSQFDGSVEIVSLERAAALMQEERDLDETDYMDHLDEGRTGRWFIAEVLGGPDAKHRNQPLPPIAGRLETMREVRQCGVEHILDRGLRAMSTGEIRRTLLCRALLSQKKLLILSDPFAGLDVTSRHILREFFQTMVRGQLDAGADMNATRVILAMERYAEVPQTITHVLEFADGAVSFCGTKDDYERLIAGRQGEAQKTRTAEKNALTDAFGQIVRETAAHRNAENESGADGQPLVSLRGVNVGWDGQLVLRDLDWTVYPNQHWLIRGPNGSGKTTLLELITGDNKQVYANDVQLFGRKRGTGETIWDIKKHLGIVSYRLHVEYRMVGGTDLLSVIISGFRDSIGLYGLPTDSEIAAAKKWLALAGFSGRERDSFASLSYGEQRAILIIRAAVKQPKVLILDEPCHGLDERQRQKILDLLETIADTKTTTLLHVTHDATEALPCEKHILELRPNETPMYRILTN